jgi:hypothetical protein
MKKLAYAALALGVIAMAIAAYHLIETWPNIKAFGEMQAKDELARPLWWAARKAGWMQIYSIWGVGGLGAILGGLATAKEAPPARNLAIAGLVLSIGALIISFTTMMAGRVG